MTEWEVARERGQLVRVDSLRKGDQFICSQSKMYTYERRDRALSGAHHVTDADGNRTLFAGCADVLKVRLS